jgi:hypothetical protein
LQTLQQDVQSDIPSGTQPTHASVGQLEDDLGAVRKGTLTGSQAQTTIQNDAAAILSSMGLSQAEVSQIQPDQQALQTAISANLPQPSTGSGSTSPSTPWGNNSVMQSVGSYLVGIPGAGRFGMRDGVGVGIGVPGGFGMGNGGGFGRWARGWR